MYDLSPPFYKERLERLDHVLGLGELLGVLARKLSLGQRMRADLAAALLHSPKIVYLDEPTIGLDIAVKDRVRDFLRELRQDGTTLMLTPTTSVTSRTSVSGSSSSTRVGRFSTALSPR
jgi:ABC-2 type transport system ATP-binding protein